MNTSTVKRNLHLFLLLWLVIACVRPANVVVPTTAQSVHLSLGNPSNARPTTNSPDNFLITLPQYALSYNRSKAYANWVSWELTDAWLGDAERQNDFRPDPVLPNEWYAVSPNDYTNTGFDRGHLCPSADRTASEEDNSSTFLMTNIIPQAPELNREAWARLEAYCRTLANEGYRLLIIAGTYGTGGEGSNGMLNSIQDKIEVPARNYKVIVAIPQ